MDRLFPSAEGTGFAVRQATGCGDPHQRLSALCPLGLGGKYRRTPRLAETGAAELWFLPAGCLKCESDVAHESAESGLRNEAAGSRATTRDTARPPPRPPAPPHNPAGNHKPGK